MCVVASFRWQCLLLGLLGGNVYYSVFHVAMSVPKAFRWQCVLYVLGGNVYSWVF